MSDMKLDKEPAAAPLYCGNCGAPIPPGKHFCEQCLAPASLAAATPPPAPVPSEPPPPPPYDPLSAYAPPPPPPFEAVEAFVPPPPPPPPAFYEPEPPAPVVKPEGGAVNKDDIVLQISGEELTETIQSAAETDFYYCNIHFFFFEDIKCDCSGDLEGGDLWDFFQQRFDLFHFAD